MALKHYSPANLRSVMRAVKIPIRLAIILLAVLPLKTQLWRSLFSPSIKSELKSNHLHTIAISITSKYLQHPLFAHDTGLKQKLNTEKPFIKVGLVVEISRQICAS